MRLRWALPCHLLGLCALRCASLRVPQEQRVAWWMEWSAELWHVREACTPTHGISWTAEKEVAAFFMGAFEDARCLNEQEEALRHAPRKPAMDSPKRCLLALLALLAVGYGSAVFLPATAALLHSPSYRTPQDLVMIQQGAARTDSVATISADQYQVWKQRQQRLFTDFAFYQLLRTPVVSGTERSSNATVARASANLFSLLGQTIDASSTTDSATPRVLLSHTLWRAQFGGDPTVIGKTIQIGATSAVVSGIVPEGAWKLPGRVDAWLQVPNDAFAGDRPGFVIGRLNPAAKYPRWNNSWKMTAPKPDGDSDDFLCFFLAERLRGPNSFFLFAAFLACLALPATTSLPLGEYRVTSRKLSWAVRVRRWSFLAGKIAILLPIIYFFSLDLAHFKPTLSALTSEYLQLGSAFSMCLFGFRWALRDQRQRCPVCLGKLTHPARVGHPSRNFLAWNGIELVCLGGHGLLHVPEISTSWFSTQRWLYLDPSWDVLFSEPQFAPASYF